MYCYGYLFYLIHRAYEIVSLQLTHYLLPACQRNKLIIRSLSFSKSNSLIFRSFKNSGPHKILVTTVTTFGRYLCKSLWIVIQSGPDVFPGLIRAQNENFPLSYLKDLHNVHVYIY